MAVKADGEETKELEEGGEKSQRSNDEEQIKKDGYKRA